MFLILPIIRCVRRFPVESSVHQLVQIAHRHSFYWGGHFSRRDGMHFEVARIV
ncbi:MAG TPA: hypothetical protein DCZ05_04785 [Deltaproteobacteria bacterium]|nr:hypothetical protein [Deltaproteobacteria bacterium]